MRLVANHFATSGPRRPSVPEVFKKWDSKKYRSAAGFQRCNRQGILRAVFVQRRRGCRCSRGGASRQIAQGCGQSATGSARHHRVAALPGKQRRLFHQLPRRHAPSPKIRWRCSRRSKPANSRRSNGRKRKRRPNRFRPRSAIGNTASRRGATAILATRARFASTPNSSAARAISWGGSTRKCVPAA